MGSQGGPWGGHHNYGSSYSDSSSSSAYPSSSSSSEHGRTRTRQDHTYPSHYPLGPWTSNFGPWHHTMRTTTSSTSWPQMAENRSASSALPPRKTPPPPILQHDQDLTHGVLAAAIVVPTLAFLAAIALVFFCLRRRSQNSRIREAPIVPVVGVKEKLGSFRRRRDPPRPPPTSNEPPIILTSEQNNAYFTGLDTSSFGSRGSSGEYQPRGSYEPPPPPYIHEPSPPAADARARSPFEDPSEEQQNTNDIALSALTRPEILRSTSNLSISSTLYSENASVHEAREARRSIVGAQIVGAMSVRSEDGNRRASDPFVSPANSPTTAAGDGSQRVSDISETDRR